MDIILYIPRSSWLYSNWKNKNKAVKNMHESIELHIQGLKEDHPPIPKAQAVAEYVAIAG
jgi:hypothetical protein